MAVLPIPAVLLPISVELSPIPAALLLIPAVLSRSLRQLAVADVAMPIVARITKHRKTF